LLPIRLATRQVLPDIGFGLAEQGDDGFVHVDDIVVSIGDHHVCRQNIHCKGFGVLASARAAIEHDFGSNVVGTFAHHSMSVMQTGWRDGGR
jgi:hypothetical protein